MEMWRRHSADPSRLESGIQGLLRQQFELLATQKLRWEGELWPGVFVEFAVHRVSWESRDAERDREKADSSVPEPSWRIDISLQLRRLGPVDLSVTMNDTKLNIQVVVVTEELATEVFAQLEPLRQRLLGIGFDSIWADVTVVE